MSFGKDGFWEGRYAEEGYIFGTDPAAFLAREAHWIEPGQSALLLADGEGRNSVFLAERGVKVTAMDYVARAIEKARALAADKGVEVDFNLADILEWDWDAQGFDAVVGVFFQFLSPDDRAEVFRGIARAIRPGGVVMLHGYGPKQIEFGTGGPGKLENLYTLDLLREAFPGWEVLVAKDYEDELSEGTRHVGRSALIDFVARKPA